MSDILEEFYDTSASREPVPLIRFFYVRSLPWCETIQRRHFRLMRRENLMQHGVKAERISFLHALRIPRKCIRTFESVNTYC